MAAGGKAIAPPTPATKVAMAAAATALWDEPRYEEWPAPAEAAIRCKYCHHLWLNTGMLTDPEVALMGSALSDGRAQLRAVQVDHQV